jgi:iron(II)-dependent oxidoreductase
MVATTTAVRRLSDEIQVQLTGARKRTDDLFSIVREDSIYDRPVPERHRIIFYLGHLEAFDWNLLAERAFGLQPFHQTFDKLFAFGIDPVGGGLPTDVPADWPERAEIERYRMRVRDTLDRAISQAFTRPADAHPTLTTLLKVSIEHRFMHAETLAYLLHRLPTSKKMGTTEKLMASSPKESPSLVAIPAGTATLGLPRVRGDEFGWDNEFQAHAVEVDEFAIEKHDVTNAQFLQFLQAGGYENRAIWNDDWQWKQQENVRHPAFWIKQGNSWMCRTMFDEVPLPPDWPVYVSHAEATAYATWAGRKLPTEAQFHRAAYGTASGQEREYPWGNEAPAERRGNFDFARWDPVPVGSYPDGVSAFGVHDLVGNGWEWTRTPFGPFPGFERMPFYPGYSADFFDGKHFVMKGGSSRTAACMLRRSFRNWFQPHYRYAYAKFRCVED